MLGQQGAKLPVSVYLTAVFCFTAQSLKTVKPAGRLPGRPAGKMVPAKCSLPVKATGCTSYSAAFLNLKLVVILLLLLFLLLLLLLFLLLLLLLLLLILLLLFLLVLVIHFFHHTFGIA